jgi:hypothetical protein
VHVDAMLYPSGRYFLLLVNLKTAHTACSDILFSAVQCIVMPFLIMPQVETRLHCSWWHETSFLVVVNLGCQPLSVATFTAPGSALHRHGTICVACAFHSSSVLAHCDTFAAGCVRSNLPVQLQVCNLPRAYMSTRWYYHID